MFDIVLIDGIFEDGVEAIEDGNPKEEVAARKRPSKVGEEPRDLGLWYRGQFVYKIGQSSRLDL